VAAFPLRATRLPAVQLYVVGLWALVVLFATALVVSGESLGDPWAVMCLVVVALLAERGGVWLTASTEISIAIVPTLFAAVLFGPLAAMLVGAASMLSDMRGPTEHPYLKWATYTASRALTGAAAGVVASACLDATSESVAGIAIDTTAAAFVGEALDVSFAAVTARLRGRARVIELVRVLGPLTLAAIPLYAPIIAVLVIAYTEVSPWTLPLFLIPAAAAQRLYVMYHEQRRLTQDVLSANERLQKANLSFAAALVTTLDARDHYTAGHSAAVAIYSRDIAAQLGLSQETCDLAHLCGLVHDIGKVGLPVGLLEKHGPLTLEERRQMEEHSAIGERILSKVDDYAEIARIVRHHHERLDGRGYPDRFEGDDIPLLSRILAVADAYNAMTSDRPYRDAMPSQVARIRLVEASGTQFDPVVVEAFEGVLKLASDSYRSGQRVDFRLTARRHLASVGPVAAAS
jgi:putative nucleotidyltransferase with HDIG domain